MYLENSESWSIITFNEDLLNFAVFTGCMYNLIDDEVFDEDNVRWPANIVINNCKECDHSKLKTQWSNWFNDIVNNQAVNIGKDTMHNFIEEIYDISNFKELEYVELRECCKTAYPNFIEWWNMQAGGKTALSLYEYIGGEIFCEYVEGLENKLNRKAKPFKLYIEIVYTGVPKVLEVNENYMIVTPNGYMGSDREWWLNKLSKLM